MTSAERIAAHVETDRQWSLLMSLARIGGLQNGGVDRQALTDLDTEAKNMLGDWARARGLSVWQDPAANFFIRLEGTDPSAAPVMIGSHLDSQPTGGKFDGAYGVVAGLEFVESVLASGAKPTRPIEVVSWMNEEGSRFSPGASGSSAFAGTRDASTWMPATTADGKPVRQELERSISRTNATMRPLGSPRPYAFIEAHIEQGPVLDRDGLAACAVDGIQGMRRIAVEFVGRTAHAGTTPHRLRHDALVAATRFMSFCERLTEAGGESLRLTVGRIESYPNSPNTVPGRVALTIDLRHPEESELARLTELIAAGAGAGEAGCGGSARVISSVAPTRFAPNLVGLLEDSARSAGLPVRRMISGAGHDSIHLSKICPTAMIFVRCKDGISHHESESATADDLSVGTRILARACWMLANRH
jgi:N-carbamoyl-L-amino-acid hydrolase